MKFFLSIPVLMLLLFQNLSGQSVSENAPVEVLGSKWSKISKKIENPESLTAVRALPLSDRANRNFERNRRVNDPVGTPDPNAETMDGRSATLDKNVKESRAPKPTIVEGFIYQARIRNSGKSLIEVLFWEYQFTERANPASVVSRQFLCGVNVKPGKEKDLSVFSTFSPSSVVSVGSLENKSGSPFEEKIFINRVEYADGTIWQRSGWSYAEMKPSITRALETPWGMEMCRSL